MRHALLPFAAAAGLTAISTAAFAHAALERPQAPAVTIAASTAGGHDQAGHGGDAGETTAAGELTIGGGWLKAMLPGQATGGGYLTVTNGGDVPDRLVAVSTPAAGKAEIHEMKVENDVMTMRPVEGGLEIPANGSIELKPGGLHLMFMQVTQPFEEGATVPVTLQFEKAGKVELALPVRAARAGSAHGH